MAEIMGERETETHTYDPSTMGMRTVLVADIMASGSENTMTVIA
jgi:hypothetical protein